MVDDHVPQLAGYVGVDGATNLSDTTQARHKAEVDDMARDFIATVLDARRARAGGTGQDCAALAIVVALAGVAHDLRDLRFVVRLHGHSDQLLFDGLDRVRHRLSEVWLLPSTTKRLVSVGDPDRRGTVDY